MTLATWPVWPFEPNWTATPVEGVDFLTTISVSATGAEQRRSLRANPRRDLEYTFLIHSNERAWCENFINNTWKSRYWLPVWPDMSRLMAYKVNGVTTIPVPNAPQKEFVVGGAIAFVQRGNRRVSEVAEITAVNSDSVEIAAALTNEYSGVVFVAPAIVAYLSPDGSENVQFTRVSDSVLTADVRLYSSQPGVITNVTSLPNGPLIMDGLIVNSYKNALGRGGYFHAASGTSEGQFIFLHGALLASTMLSGGNLEEQIASRWFQRLVYQMLDAMGDGNANGPILRQEVPTDPTTLCELHWLFAARGDVNSRNIVYAYEATVSDDGKLRIPENARGATTYNVWKIYPATSQLLYESIQSPAYDIDNPQAQTQTTVAMSDSGPHPYWTVEQFDTAITIPATNDVGGSNAGITSWKIIYGYDNDSIVPKGFAYEAFPDWTMIRPGYVACAPDTFRWFDAAMGNVIPFDTRDGAATKWTNLRAAMRRTCVRGQAIDDLRTILKAWPGFDAIPINSDPDGMFCYCSDPLSNPPAVASANAAWTGFELWARDAAGNIIADLPTGSQSITQYQIGRGFDDSWREAETYQYADWYMYVEFSISRPLAKGEYVMLYMSATQQYDKTKRWLADMSTIAGFNTSGVLTGIYIPIESFRTRTTDNIGTAATGAPLTPGQTFQAYGISIELKTEASVIVGKMRPVSGPSKAWVDANQAQALIGSKMPFFPGSLPFAINADTKLQQFVGWNGSPFHGYQQPDLWLALESDAEIVHADMVTGRDVALPNADGSWSFPISDTDVNGNAKSKAAILCEQQVQFLAYAQAQYHTDGGPLGPFAHTFVLNTPARASLGNPRPHSWVYVNDDPNTRWVGYQTRPLESLCKLVLGSQSLSGWATVNTLALATAKAWLDWFNSAWTSATQTIFTDFPDPAISGPQANYDEPHAAALILRACLWMKQAGQLTYADDLMTRLWTYLERIWAYNQGTTMAGTWSDDPSTEDWYGFWHGEVIMTLSLLLKNPTYVPAGIDLTTVKQRLMDTYAWLRATGVKSSLRAEMDGQTLWNNYAVFEITPAETTDNTRQVNRLLAELDTSLGPVLFSATGTRPLSIQQFLFVLKGRAKTLAFEAFFKSARGQQVPFWMSTHMEDFTAAKDIQTGDYTLTVEDVGYADWVWPLGFQTTIAVHFRDSTNAYFTITGAAKGSAGTEVLSLQEPFLRSAKTSDILRISYLKLMRFATDRVEYSRVTTKDGVTTVTASFQEAPELRNEAAAYYTT